VPAVPSNSTLEVRSIHLIAVHVISAKHLIQNKLKSGRLRDLADVEAIREADWADESKPE
jgi:hypothetical protein